jgi:hypothetical protein
METDVVVRLIDLKLGHEIGQSIISIAEQAIQLRNLLIFFINSISSTGLGK